MVAACSAPSLEQARQLPAAEASDARAAVAANNAFAASFYSAVASNPNTPANFFFSPFSISVDLAMLDAGAANETDAQLRSALQTTLSSDALGAAYKALLASLAAGTHFGNYDLTLAQRLFGQQGFAYVPSYLATTKNDYGAALEPVDFADDPSAAVTTIDSWVSTQTDGAIPNLLADGDVDAFTRLEIVDAVRFSGTWAVPFPPAVPGQFTLGDGSTVSAQMMASYSASLDTADFDGFSLGAFPFSEQDMSMIVLLPDGAAGLPALEATLTPETLASWLAAPREPFDADGSNLVELPKYSVTTQMDLDTTLGALGVTDAWIPETADFSGIDGARDLYVNNAVHSATVTVDEHGAQASAATGTGVVILLMNDFVADHPFIFLIHDEVTGAVLFMGRFADPTQQ